jgi:metallo-beta-lactamase family protein
MTTTVTFLGAVGTVTGSKYLVETGERRILVDCGLFQGFKQLRLRNWAPLPFDPATADAVLLTHAHLDHSGYLPLFVKHGFRGPVITTPATRDLCKILLPDSGYLHERDAEFANRHGFSKHKPALPLYTERDAVASLEYFAPTPFRTEHQLGEHLSASFLPAGHILGAAMIRLRAGGLTVVFSGDLGRFDSATMVDPTSISEADYLVVESTYGDRLHDREDPEDALARIINQTVARGGTIVVPSFAVGRTQTLLYHIHRLKLDRRIPDVPVYLDSPMAINVSEVFCADFTFHRLSAEACRAACNVARYTREVEESKALDQDEMPKIIISASGMATGGRVLHHIKRYGPDRASTILFAGFQAAGTRGAAMTGGAEFIKFHGQMVPIRADVANLHMLSAHADADEIMRWLSGFQKPPKTTFITHGEPAASDALRLRIASELGWSCVVPEYKEDVELT